MYYPWNISGYQSGEQDGSHLRRGAAAFPLRGGLQPGAVDVIGHGALVEGADVNKG